jgi:hypothetical protein
MKLEKLKSLTDEQLTQEEKKQKDVLKIYVFAVGLQMCFAIYSFFKNGFSLFLIIPFVFILAFSAIREESQAIQKEIESRKSK